jgi:signal transduction histidine kinase
LKRVASLGSYTRSAAQATFSAYRSLPVRWRLAGGSAVLTFVILCGFASIVGVLTTRQVRGQFNDEMRSAVDQLLPQLNPRWNARTYKWDCGGAQLSDYATAEHAQIRVFSTGGFAMCSSTLPDRGRSEPTTTPNFTLPSPPVHVSRELGYRVLIEPIRLQPVGEGYLLYARPLSDVDHTLARVRFFLILGVLGGTILALAAGLALAQRAMRPVADLTEAAREIARTRDPRRRLPHVEADDEVAELARTLEGMLQSLDSARGETEAALDRQREFVADASHELRTPLTSVLANLELLAEELEGEQAETAHAALRSTRRMRRLVGDLLLLARADANRVQPHRATDLADVVVEAAAELEPVAEDHDLLVDAEPAVVRGARDELHRLVVNLIENAIRHTPPGTHVRASTASHGGQALLVVEDDGPGIPPELELRVFERFVRGGGDRGRGSGLGLAIVRAVAESHGGTVALEQPAGGGTRFVIRIPIAGATVTTPTADGDQASGTEAVVGSSSSASPGVPEDPTGDRADARAGAAPARHGRLRARNGRSTRA